MRVDPFVEGRTAEHHGERRVRSGSWDFGHELKEEHLKVLEHFDESRCFPLAGECEDCHTRKLGQEPGLVAEGLQGGERARQRCFASPVGKSPRLRFEPHRTRSHRDSGTRDCQTRLALKPGESSRAHALRLVQAKGESKRRLLTWDGALLGCEGARRRKGRSLSPEKAATPVDTRDSARVIGVRRRGLGTSADDLPGS